MKKIFQGYRNTNQKINVVLSVKIPNYLQTIIL